MEESTEIQPTIEMAPEEAGLVGKNYLDERLAKVWDLKIRGVGVPTIAKALNVSTRTIYEDLKRVGQRYRDEILKSDPLTLVAENLQWIDEMERVALYDLAQAGDQIIKTKDPNTGVVTEQTIANPNKSKFYANAMKAREMKIKLMMDTNILPKDSTDKMFHKLETHDPTNVKEVEETIIRTDDDVKRSIKNLLKHGRMI